MVLVLRHVENLSYKEIGEILGVPVTTIQMRLHRAHKKLRTCMTTPQKGGVVHDLREIQPATGLFRR
ncbi:RNA polymerase sigma factor [Brevibacillus laterosporus]|uniref:RNA polymerase sigma factor n=1 Tax=Brevibacillus laterosporus TaxID=1465 RepID=UPI002157E5A0|nr:sigma factor-like helix-turn-helix DNA-binding protein [Brevibacillus laterosporus]